MLKENTWTLAEEKKISDEWHKKEPYRLDRKEKIYSIDTPPPYVNAPIHMGHAVVYIYMDFFARYKRMKGFSVLFPLGLDRNGLPIELAAEKKFGIRAEQVGREKFLEMCKKILEEASNESVKTFARLGISFSSYKFGEKIGQAYETDSESYRRLSQETFIDLWEKGLVYEASKVVNYCPGCRTTIADAEVAYEERETEIYHIKFKVEQDKDIIIATTRPELLGACAAILFNPSDTRYKKLAGKHAITPLYEKEVRIKAHPIAKSDFGSGILMMCSFGDLTDIRFFRDEGLKAHILIGIDGKMNKNAGFLEGMYVKQARKEIVAKLKEKGLLVKTENLQQRAPICERSKDPIEFIALEEYYLKQLEFKEKMLQVAHKIKFYDESSRQILIDWINGLSEDWPLSRRRYYATPIPIWKCKKCGEKIIGKKGKYWQPWREAPEKKCKCGGELEGETRVFDTWFDSSISPHYILGYGRDAGFFKKSFPCTLRPQGKEIVRTWLYYTLLRIWQLEKKSAFEDIWIHYHILDAQGRKMAKSVGNVIDPQKIIEKFGSEALRFWAAIEGNIIKQDLRCSEERIAAESKTLNKLWNISKFVSSFKAGGRAKLCEADKLMIAHMDSLIKFADKEYSGYNFFEPAVKVRHFLWEIFASHYLELVKGRAYNGEGKFSKEEQAGAIFTLNYCLEKMLLLLAPIVPAITEKIFSDIYDKNVHEQEFPKVGKSEKAGSAGRGAKAKIESLLAVNSFVWKTKREKQLSLKAPLKEIVLPKEHENLHGLVEDLKAAHSAEKISFSSAKEIQIRF